MPLGPDTEPQAGYLPQQLVATYFFGRASRMVFGSPDQEARRRSSSQVGMGKRLLPTSPNGATSIMGGNALAVSLKAEGGRRQLPKRRSGRRGMGRGARPQAAPRAVHDNGEDSPTMQAHLRRSLPARAMGRGACGVSAIARSDMSRREPAPACARRKGSCRPHNQPTGHDSRPAARDFCSTGSSPSRGPAT